MSDNLKAFGFITQTSRNSLKIYGNPRIKPSGQIKIAASLDHRIQMCSVLLAASTPAPVIVQGISTIKTSFPNFFLLLKKIGLQVKYEI